MVTLILIESILMFYKALSYVSAAETAPREYSIWPP